MSKARLYPAFPLMQADILAEYDITDLDGRGLRMPEKYVLYAVVCMLHPKRILEIGISRGHSTSWLARGLADHPSVGIDPRRLQPGTLTAVDNWSKEGGGYADDSAPVRKRLADTGLTKYVEIVKADSQEFMKKQPSNSFDIVFVDGDHSEEMVRADIEQARRLASRLVIAHDVCSPELPHIRRVCEEIGGGVFLDGERGMWLHQGDLE